MHHLVSNHITFTRYVTSWRVPKSLFCITLHLPFFDIHIQHLPSSAVKLCCKASLESKAVLFASIPLTMTPQLPSVRHSFSGWRRNAWPTRRIRKSGRRRLGSAEWRVFPFWRSHPNILILARNGSIVTDILIPQLWLSLKTKLRHTVL